MGMKGATSNYSCLWCKVHKDKRWEMDKDIAYYNSEPLKRSLAEVISMAKKKSNTDKYSCEHEPLLKIDLDHIILDELHLVLRVMDVLIDNLVKEAIDWDQNDNFHKRKSEKETKHLSALQTSIRSCGVTFDIWEKKNEEGRPAGQYDFTSLLGSDKKKILEELPDKLSHCVRPDTCPVVTKIWRNFYELYKTISSSSNNPDVNTYFKSAQEWVNLFTSLRSKAQGYKRARVTPYMHAMVYHVPKFMEMHMSVKIFTGQGVEKNNDVARNVILRKSNKKAPAVDVLHMEARQWKLRERERSKREYKKTDTNYWEVEIKKKRQNGD